jgi:hypothetical protein
MGDQQQHLRATGILVIKDQPIEEGFNLLPMLLCASSQTVFLFSTASYSAKTRH